MGEEMHTEGAHPEDGGETLARQLREGRREVVLRVTSRLIAVRNDNLIERPWGNRQLLEYKGLAASRSGRFGEAFEISAYPGDPEAGDHPSLVRLEDGSELPLPDLLEAAGEEVLGADFVAAYGRQIPLLPKTLNVKELLSVQIHPPGYPEVYVVLAAETGASLRLGWRRQVEPEALAARLRAGRRAQEDLLAGLRPGADLLALQGALAAGLARGCTSGELVADLAPWLRPGLAAAELTAHLELLQRIYCEMLDLLNEVPVEPGQVIYNADPAAAARTGLPSAEVHALGNPEAREILLLEVRRPGPTLRAWDHVRFPLRRLDLDAAFATMSFRPTRPEDFAVSLRAVAGQPGVYRSVANDAFVVDHLRPTAAHGVELATDGEPRTLHAIRGAVTLRGTSGERLGSLRAGESALVPAGLGRCHLAADGDEAEVIQLRVPLPTRPVRRGTRAAFHGTGRPAAGPREGAPAALFENLGDLRRVVAASQGPREVLAIVNGGDAALVTRRLGALAVQIFRADGATTFLAHEERQRRGQLLGLLDALRRWRAVHGELDPEAVALGIMMPGKGTRLSPLTQRLHGIKPFFPMPIRTGPDGPWLSGAAASLYSWTLVVHHLQRMGFRGVAWKWGDEPQIPAHVLAHLDLDLSRTDAVRFGSQVVVTEDLAAHKEWLFCDPATGRLRLQVRRRPRAELLERFGIPSPEAEVEAHVHIGSPAFSHLFLAEAEHIFGELPGWLDVDGYLFEALTHERDAWDEEVARDPELAALLTRYPHFYQQVRELKDRLEERRGHELAVQVIDFGAGLYWGDIGQLGKAREVFTALGEGGDEGELARDLASLEGVEPDEHGNRVAGDCRLPRDGSVRDSVLVDSSIEGTAAVRGAVLVDSRVGRAHLAPGAVAVRCAVADLTLGRDAFAFESLGEHLEVPDGHVHTSIPRDPRAEAMEVEDWWADSAVNPGRGEAYTEPQLANPTSYAAKFEQMRQRAVDPDTVEARIDTQARQPLREAIRRGGS